MKIIDVPKHIRDLLALAVGGADWGAPEQVTTTLKPVPPFDPTMLPDAVRPWVEDIAYRMQCPIDFVATAALSMLGSVIGSGCSVRPKQKDSWTEVSNVWGAAIGDPGRLKSPAIAQAMAPLHALDHEARQDHEQAMARHQVEMVSRKMQAEALKKTMSKAGAPTQDNIAEIAALSVEPETPKCRRYFTNDTTFESLTEILRNSPRGLLVLHDELTGLLEGFERQGREGERQFYLTAWNGTSPHRVDRIGRGEVYIPRLTATLYGGIQPARLEQYLYETQAGGGNDGFFQRFQLAVYPDDAAEFKVVDEAPDEVAANKVKSIVGNLAHCDFKALGAEVEREDGLPFFRFDKRAQATFNRFLLDLDRKCRAEDLSLMAQHLSKYRKLLPALALISHLVEIAAAEGPKIKPARRIALPTLKRALRWIDYLEAHARRVYALASDVRVHAAQALAKKVTKGELVDGFSERDVYVKEWSNLQDPDEVNAACSELELAGWIRRIVAERKGPGRPASPRYAINPALLARASATTAPTKPTKPKRRS